jgi:hypothetical protein
MNKETTDLGCEGPANRKCKIQNVKLGRRKPEKAFGLTGEKARNNA